MDIVIDFSFIKEIGALPPYLVMWRLFVAGGWMPIAITFLWLAKELWIFYIKKKWGATQKSVLLAIDIPRGNEQSPKAVENMFSYLAGAHGSINLIEKYWEGKFQLSFSLETVSIDGYTQFLIRTPESFRDLVESAVYAQYPDAEITEVNDYTAEVPTKYPDDEYDIWGTEFIQAKNSAYPIKTYKEFENLLGAPEVRYKDTMAALMDLCSSLRKGEQLWYQIILIPIGFDWPDIGDKEIRKILKEKDTSKNIGDAIIDSIMNFIDFIGEMILPLWGEEAKKEVKEEVLKMMNLKPKEKKQVESIQEKVSKLGFEFKIRVVYAAKKDLMNKPKAGSGFVGFMKQFAVLDLNNLKPDTEKTMTKASYFFVESRLNAKKNNIIRNYIARDDWKGRKPGILNIEELATIWHFPVEAVVKAPMIQKAPGRKAEPPMSLPMSEGMASDKIIEPIFEEPAGKGIAVGHFEGTEIKKTGEVDDIFEEAMDIKDIGESVKTKAVPPGNLPMA